MQQENILISVIIPIYNAQTSLSNCLDSVLEQSLREIEIICVDDGSTDNTVAILNSYKARDNRVQVLRQKNSFAGTARNLGLRYAKGEYIAFLDADDTYIDADVLRDLYCHANKYKLDMLKGGFEFFDTSKQRAFVNAYSINSSISSHLQKQILDYAHYPQHLLLVADVPWNGIYLKTFLDENQITFNSLRCVNDHSFFIHCLIRAQRIMVISRMMVQYRVAQAGSLVGGKADHFNCHISSYGIVRELAEHLPHHLKLPIMQNELYAVLNWYTRLKDQARNPSKIELELTEFLHSYDETDVGNEYLVSFGLTDLYHQKRYGHPPSQKRKSAASRLLHTWCVFGMRHTLMLLKEKIVRR